MKWFIRSLAVAVFVAANIAIATPAEAGLQNDVCSDPEGGEYELVDGHWCTPGASVQPPLTELPSNRPTIRGLTRKRSASRAGRCIESGPCLTTF